MRGILKYMDDLLFLAGIASLTYAGFLCHEIVGFAVLGVGLIAYGVVVARGSENILSAPPAEQGGDDGC